MEQPGLIEFERFLRSRDIYFVHYNSLLECVAKNFLSFNERLLRDLIETAIASRNTNALQNDLSSNPLGVWSEIIDTVKEVLANRQQMASQNFEKLIAIGMEGDKKAVTSTISKLYQSGQVDYLFEDVLMEAIDRCKALGNSDYIAMFQYFKLVIDKNKEVEAIRKANHTSKPEVEAISKANSISKPEVKAIIKANDASKPEDEAIGEASNIQKQEAESMYEEADRVVLGKSEISTTVGPSDEMLVHANIFLRDAISSGNGDVKKLRADILEACRSDEVDRDALGIVLADNITACRQMGYTVKEKLFTFIQNFILQSGSDAVGERESVGTEGEPLQYHAPKFIARDETAQPEDVIAPECFIRGEGLPSISTSGNRKKVGKVERRRRLELAKKLGEQFAAQDWAVCDTFLPPDLIRRVRVESDLFTEHFEQSEIWVGKTADVGAHLRVPEVRGDKVLWMCGGRAHRSAPEGETREIKTHGEIEPCKMEVKAKAPLRKFHALKELLEQVDALVEDMKSAVPELVGLYERSDAMLAVYPGEGSRFARHIDNTTGDGRRLTVLVYLNPSWEPSLGGALRLSPSQGAGMGVQEKEVVTGKEEGEGDKDQSSRVDVYPFSGRLAMFHSARVPHEVLPTYGQRHALTVWYYDGTERATAVKAAAMAGRASKVRHAGEAAQAEAKALIAELLGDDVETGSGAELALTRLRQRVRKLSEPALEIVSSITGAPSASSFRDGFELLTTGDVAAMRQLFRKMGLK